ncbi:MAG: bi-domain-containing oxidoreductase [Phycisphaerae bacterium]|nr:bi-domain-containing oxidoreductase [Phycisphaerae bacterium]
MKQIVQNMRSGQMTVAEVPAPNLRGPGALIQTRCSLISAGTEKSMMELAKKSLLGKARQRPDLVKQFYAKVKRDGLRAALNTAFSRLDQPLLQGYSSAGDVLAVSEAIDNIAVGDRVACGGGGYASHAGVVYVPRNLMVKVPSGVSDEEACQACVASVAMQAVRIGRLELGEHVVVIGLGLIGQMLMQIVRANGCRVLGCDPDAGRQEVARELGIDGVSSPDSLERTCGEFTRGRGADAVFITAATESNAPLEQAVEISRFRGRIVGVGDFGMKITRKPFYERELEFRMSMSYGPGRYDTRYEEKGIDYPPAYVPWTEQRNMASVLDLMQQGKLNVKKLITHRFDIEQAEEAYAVLGGDVSPEQRGMAVILTYSREQSTTARLDMSGAPIRSTAKAGRVGIGMIGAGMYASSMLLPILKRMEGVELVSVATATGPSAEHAARKFGFARCTTDYQELLADDAIDLIITATRHGMHPVITAAALRAGKHAFVEKPLAITEDGLADVLDAQRQSGRILMVGFNRRFAPLTQKARQHFGERHGPLTISFRCNAGAMPSNHWSHDPEEGGGRIISEACHFIDLCSYLDGSRPEHVYAHSVRAEGAVGGEDDCFITLGLASGSVASVGYLTGGDKSFSKERIEIFGDGKVFVIEDFRTGLAVRGGSESTFKMTQDKGQANLLRALVDAIRNGTDGPISVEDLMASSLATIRAVESIRSGMPIRVMGEGPSE